MLKFWATLHFLVSFFAVISLAAHAQEKQIEVVAGVRGAVVMGAESATEALSKPIPSTVIRIREPIIARKADRVKINTVAGAFWISQDSIKIERQTSNTEVVQKPHGLVGGGRGFDED